ncbi:MAG: hypothetical protein WAW41_10075, partial [Methylobacter sp.]
MVFVLFVALHGCNAQDALNSRRSALVVIHKCLGDAVIPAGIAGIQKPWMAMSKLAVSLATRELPNDEHSHPCALGNCSCFALPPASLQSWIPAIPAGMTCFYRLVYNDERNAWEREKRRRPA